METKSTPYEFITDKLIPDKFINDKFIHDKPIKAEPVKGESGQAIVEYIILLTIILIIYVLIVKLITQSGLAQKYTKMLTGPFASAYKYGLSGAKGPDEGGPDLHPRFIGGNSGRIFINPKKTGG